MAVEIAVCALIGALLAIPVYVTGRLLAKRRKLELPARDRLDTLVVPLVMAVAGGVIGWRCGFELRSIYLMLILSLSAVVAVLDFRFRIIPNELILALIGVTALFAALGFIEFDIISSLIGLAGCLIVFLIPAALGKQIGMGDVKLAAAMGFCAGWLGSLYAVAIMGGLIFLFTMLWSRTPVMSRFKAFIPMGPFIVVGLMTVLII